MTALRTLRLIGGLATSLPDISGLAVTTLELGNFPVLQIVPSLPSTLTTITLTSLLSASLSSSGLYGLPSVTSLSLTSLGPYSTHVTSSIANMTTLASLLVNLPGHDSTPAATLPAAVLSMSGLLAVSLRGVAISGYSTIPGSWPSSVQSLALDSLVQDGGGSSGVNNPIPAGISTLASLKSLTLSNMPTVDSFPNLGGLGATLTSLTFSSLGLINGGIPDSFASLTKLQQLTLNAIPNVLNSQIQGPIFSKFTNLVTLSLASNSLNEKIDDSLAALTLLTAVDLSNNVDMCGCVNKYWDGVAVTTTNTQISTSCSIHCPLTRASEAASMVTLRSALGNLPSSWSNGTDPCGVWVGVTCENAKPAYITALSLRGYNVTGTLPSGTSSSGALYFKKLTSLDLSSTSLSGTIPSGISGLTYSSASLLYLNVSNAYFSGSLPSMLSSLTLLTALDVSSNRFGGSAATALGSNLSNLTTLGLASNYGLCGGSGTYGSVVALGGGIGGTSLGRACPRTDIYESLAMANMFNALTDSAGSLTNWNNATTADPCAVASPWAGLTCSNPGNGLIASITGMAITNWQVAGTLSTFLGQLSALTGFLVTVSSISGTVPSEVSKLLSLSSFSVLGSAYTPSSVSGTIAASIWSSLTSLSSLTISRTSVSGAIGVSIGNLTALKQMDVSYSSFGGTLPTTMSLLGSLSSVNVKGNADFCGYAGAILSTIPSVIYDGTSNFTLNWLATCPATRSADAATLSALRTALGGGPAAGGLSSGGNTGAAWSSSDPTAACSSWRGLVCTGDAPQTVSGIALASSGVTGSLPSGSGALSFTALTSLDLSGNSLSGTLPLDLAGLTGRSVFSLLKMNLSSNPSISGTLPTSIYALSALTALDASYLGLRGSIPVPAIYYTTGLATVLSSVPTLKSLRIAGNAALCGTVPASLVSQVTDESGTAINASCTSVNIVEGAAMLLLRAGLVWPPAATAVAVPVSAWNATDDACNAIPSWPGVVCDSLGSITAIAITSQSVSGTLSSAIGLLTKLQSLWITGTSISGTISSSIGALSLLTSLSLTHQGRVGQMTSSLPTEIGRCTALVNLAISGHSLNGRLPLSLGNLTLLSSLDLSSNTGLWGTIPASWGKLTNITTVLLQSNALAGSLAVALAGLNNATLVNLQGNADLCGSAAILSGVGLTAAQRSPPPAPSSTSSCSSSTYATPSYSPSGPSTSPTTTSTATPTTGVSSPSSGPSPPSSSPSSSPTTSSSTSPGSGSPPSNSNPPKPTSRRHMLQQPPAPATTGASSGTSSQQGLLYDGSSFVFNTATCPPTVASQVTALLALKSQWMQPGAPASPTLTNWTSATDPCTAAWPGVQCSPDVPASIIGLSLPSSLLTGTLPGATLAALPALRLLNLSRNGFFNSIPTSVGTLFELTALDLGYSGLEGSVPSALGALTKMQLLVLESNTLRGSVPPAMLAISSLTALRLKSNADLCGSSLAPPSWLVVDTSGTSIGSACPLGNTLAADSAALTSLIAGFTTGGTTPAALLSWTGSDPCASSWQGLTCSASGAVQAVNLTSLSGNIPTALSQFTRLRSLSLTGNTLSSIPATLSSLTLLSSLALPANGLSSTIPSSLSALTGLQAVDFSSNPGLSGSYSTLLTLPKLLTLSLSSTGIVGPFPFLNATSARRRLLATASTGVMTSLSLANTATNGTFPVGLYSLGPLVSIDFTNCALSGVLPSDLGLLSNTLTSIALANNNLGGSIPASTWPAAFYLRVVSALSGNALCSQELLLSPPLVVTMSVQSAAALQLTWAVPPLGLSPSALRCLVGYKITYAACSDSSVTGGCALSSVWDTQSGYWMDYSPAVAATGTAAAAPYILAANASALNLPTVGNVTAGTPPLFLPALATFLASGVSSSLYYKFRVQLVDVDGNTNAPANCTLLTTTGCLTAQSPLRPLRLVSVPVLGDLSWGVVTPALTVTLSPGPDVGSDVTITPTVVGGLITVIPSSLSFAAGETNKTFRMLSSAAGYPSTVTYVVSSTQSDGATPYGLVPLASTTRLVADNVAGTAIAYTIASLCPVGAYPDGSAVTIVSNGQPYTTRGCLVCPALTTTVSNHTTDRSDCKCSAGYADARALLPTGYGMTDGVTPCLDASIFCQDGSECVTFSAGAPVGIAEAYWKYQFRFQLNPPPSLASNLKLNISDVKTLTANTVIYPCATGHCGSNATGLGGTGCAAGATGTLCAQCIPGYFTTAAGVCAQCANTAALGALVGQDIGVAVGLLAALAVVAYLLSRVTILRRAFGLDTPTPATVDAKDGDGDAGEPAAKAPRVTPLAPIGEDDDEATAPAAADPHGDHSVVPDANGHAVTQSDITEAPRHGDAHDTDAPVGIGPAATENSRPAELTTVQRGEVALRSLVNGNDASSLPTTENMMTVGNAAAAVGTLASAANNTAAGAALQRHGRHLAHELFKGLRDEGKDQGKDMLRSASKRALLFGKKEAKPVGDGGVGGAVVAFIATAVAAVGDKIKILMSYLQIVTLLPTVYAVNWPPVFTAATSAFSLVAFNYFSSIPMDCIVQRTYYLGLYFQCALPVVVILLLAIGCTAVIFIKPAWRATVENVLFKGSVLTLFLVYPSLSGAIVSFFSCQMLGENFYVMRYAQTTTCYDADYYRVLPFAVVMVIIVPIGVPCVFLTILVRAARAVRLGDAVFIARFGFLTQAYKIEFFWFEIFELFRKLFLSGVAILIVPGTATQIMVAQCMAFLAVVVTLATQPYLLIGDTVLAVAAHAQIFLLLSLGQMIRVGDSGTYNQTLLAAVMVLTVGGMLGATLYAIFAPAVTKIFSADAQVAPDGPGVSSKDGVIKPSPAANEKVPTQDSKLGGGVVGVPAGKGEGTVSEEGKPPIDWWRQVVHSFVRRHPSVQVDSAVDVEANAAAESPHGVIAHTGGGETPAQHEWWRVMVHSFVRRLPHPPQPGTHLSPLAMPQSLLQAEDPPPSLPPIAPTDAPYPLSSTPLAPLESPPADEGGAFPEDDGDDDFERRLADAHKRVQAIRLRGDSPDEAEAPPRPRLILPTISRPGSTGVPGR